jgi:exonuclease SbcC
MKPLHLTMSAFGPYKDLAEIDFTKFGDRMFLINGPTGAGKTTIFDAICYALYGEPSGQFRETSTLRSGFASPDTVTFVKFVFAYQGKEYTITRYPNQLRPSKRGGKQVEDKARVELVGPGFSPISSIPTANKKIIEIIGLDRDQFEQTMMIAQGDFNKMINSNTEDRVVIFRKILKTNDLRSFIDKLDDLDKAQQTSLKELNDRIIGRLHAYQTTDETLAALINAKDIAVRIDESLSLCAQEQEKDQTQLASLAKTADEVSEAKDALLKSHAKVKTDNANHEHYLTSLEKKNLLAQKSGEMDLKEQQAKKARNAQAVLQSSRAVDQAKQSYDGQVATKSRLDIEEPSLKTKLSQAEEAQKKVPELEKEKQTATENLTNDKNIKDKLQRLATAENELALANLQAEQAGKDYETKEKEKKDCESAIANLQAKINSYQDDGLKAGSIATLSTLANELLNIRNLRDVYEDYLKDKKLYEKSQAAYLKSQEKATQDLNVHTSALKAYLDEQAGVLAENLKDGDACPVCGSKNHPHLATKKETVLTREAIDSLDRIAKLSQKQAEDDSTFASNTKVSVDRAAKDVARQYLALAKKEVDFATFEADLQGLFDKNTSATKDANANLLAATEKENAHKADINESKRLTASLAGLDSSFESAKHVKEDAVSRKTAAATKVTDLKNETAGQSLVSLNAKTEADQKAFNEAQRQIDEITKAYNLAQGNWTSHDTSRKANERDLPLAEKNWQENVKQLAETIAANGFASLEEAKAAMMDGFALDRLEKEVADFKNEFSGVSALVADDLTKGYDKIAPVDETPFEAEEQEAEAKAKEANEMASNLRGKIVSNADTLKAIVDERASSAALCEKAKEIHLLATTADGHLTGGAAHIDFEVYYQAQIFEEILSSASQKFSYMSDGRYALIRRAVPTDNVGHFGLDIDVKDFETGKIRPVSSLSGGESFMASLSLALSLSEVIQAKAGGIELDSMFIDEGFGTLDPESLSLAVKTLTNLSNSSHRLIGVISHVEALKNSITARIDVTKGSKGSSLTQVIE